MPYLCFPCDIFSNDNFCREWRHRIIIADEIPVRQVLEGLPLPSTALAFFMGLDDIQVTQKTLAHRGSPFTCTACNINVGIGGVAKRLECGHIFHAQCLESHVQRSNRCPVPNCDRQLPLDDLITRWVLYRNQQNDQQGQGGQGGEVNDEMGQQAEDGEEHHVNDGGLVNGYVTEDDEENHDGGADHEAEANGHVVDDEDSQDEDANNEVGLDEEDHDGEDPHDEDQEEEADHDDDQDDEEDDGEDQDEEEDD